MPSLLDVLGYAGNALDLPGSSVRDLLTGNNPFDQWLTPFSDQNRATGRDVLAPLLGANEETGMAGWLDNPMEGFKDIAGFGAEMLLDPTNLIPGRAILRAMKGRKAAKAVNAGIDAENLANVGKYAKVNPKVASRVENPMKAAPNWKDQMSELESQRYNLISQAESAEGGFGAAAIFAEAFGDDFTNDLLTRGGVKDQYDALGKQMDAIRAENPTKRIGYTPAPENPMFPGVELMHHGGHDMSASATKANPYGVFDLGRLKTGEGNNVFGPGAYKADAETTSAGYRDMVQEKLDEQFKMDPNTLKAYFAPGNIIDSYTGKDRVLAFKPGEGYSWAVQVQKVGADGVTPIEPPRWHATPPDMKSLEKVLGPGARPKAKLYKYDAPAGTKDRFLNWNAPVSAQPPAVQAIANTEYPGMTPDLWDELNSLVDMRDQQYKLSRDQLDVWGSDNPMDKFRFDTMTQQLAELDKLITAKQSELYTKNVPDTLIWSDDPTGAMKTGEDLADELMGGSPSEATLADTAGLRAAGIPGVKNLAGSTGRTSYNYAIWDQDLLNSMRVREIDGQRVPINPTTLVQQQAVPARRGIADENLLDLTNPMREKMEVPNALKPVVAGAVFNLLARQNNYGGAL